MTFRETVKTGVDQALSFREPDAPVPAAERPALPTAREPDLKAQKEAAKAAGKARSKRHSLDHRLTGPRPKKPKRYRTLFLSDIHLGTPGCKADLLLDFLRHHEAETIYLIGDIVDGWRLKRSWYWNAAHNAVIQEFLRKSRKGTTIVYVPGNHDEVLRDYTGLSFGGIDVMAEAIHETADGRSFLILHGDQFDSVVKYAKWLAYLGDYAYSAALVINNWLHEFRRFFGMPYWSLSAYLKNTVKNAVEYISSYELAVAKSARDRGVDGVICGHIHHAEIREMDGVLYCNDGDWVESCTAIAESGDGQLDILTWQQFSWEHDIKASTQGRSLPAEAAVG